MKTYGDLLEYAIQQKQYGHDVFVEYEAHIDKIRVGVSKNGWERDKFPIELEEKINEASPQDFIDFIKNTLGDDATEEHF